ncbi:hypothetical protein [Alteriqipengyuania lutimaris]|uniref:DUF4129 domain-containing protein n=1 Tax=Alteriqipengyuania lutimaris TaxID=1538146 RepID=A0A395LHD5_9SPHN|nr:hypothetical protein [Alteriqipengyuania lutimaris]MBB3034820.1 hypothetical protein [Alteriqipengyuania lutimaris]RDS76338.1 hypothetical protein DL238_01070 [Alteriqipengyuania lutimaris]
MTIGAGTDDAAADAWRSVRDDSDIQFAPIEPPAPREMPEWLRAVGEFLVDVFGPLARAFVAAWPVLQWVLVGVGVILLALLIARIAGLEVFAKRDAAPDEGAEPAIDPAEARALLDDADALAAKGLYGEAVRLLLARSIGQIATRRPDLVQPSSTARELARLDGLPEAARTAFAAIARAVERALFALEDLSEPDWRTARAAYADFAQERG